MDEPASAPLAADGAPPSVGPTSADGPSAVEHPDARHGWGRRRRPKVRLGWGPRWIALGVVLVLVASSLLAASLLSAPYIVYSPGSAFDTAPAISMPDTRTYPEEGAISFLTVSLRGASTRVSYTEALWGWIRGDSDVYPRQLILGDQTGEESREQSLQMMQSSQLLAAKVALEHLGYEVGEQGEGAAVISTVSDAPVAEVVEPGDVIVAVDGEPVELQQDLRAALDDDAPGDDVELTVERGAALGDPAAEPEVETVTAELIGDPADPDRALLGVTVATWLLEYDLPFPVTIDTEDVGGPSAGLALTLGVLDQLTPGSLTGGNAVAVTGEILPDGTVAEVGGVAQKAVAADRAGADLILVPASEASLAREFSGGVPVVGVEDLDDALQALADVGGNARDLPRQGS